MERNNACMFAIQKNVSIVHDLSKLDYCVTTYIETKAIIEGMYGSLKNVDPHNFDVIINLKRVWNHIINNYQEIKLDLENISLINNIVGNGLVIDAGKLRSGDVGVNGVIWQPAIPNKEVVKEKIKEISKIDDPIDRALEYICFGIRNQLFYDANKRTSFLMASSILINENIGLLSVSENNYTEFNELLRELFNSNKKDSLKNFFKNKCLEYQPNYIIDEYENRKDKNVMAEE